jgi:hypothetical protein
MRLLQNGELVHTVCKRLVGNDSRTPLYSNTRAADDLPVLYSSG